MTTIAAGQMNQRLTLQRRADGADSIGQPNGEWITVATVWGRTRPMRSRERLAADQVQNVSDVVFSIRWRADINATWRVVWRGKPHNVIGEPIDVDGARTVLELMASTGKLDGG